MEAIRLGVIDNAQQVYQQVEALLAPASEAYQVSHFLRLTSAWPMLAGGEIQVVLLCHPANERNMPQLDALVSHHASVPVVVVPEQYDQKIAGEALQRGAADCLNLATITSAGLARALENAMLNHRLRDQVAFQNQQLLAQQRLSVLFELIDNVSYETTQLLTGLLGYIELLQSKHTSLDPTLARHLEMISKSGKRLAEILHKINTSSTPIAYSLPRPAEGAKPRSSDSEGFVTSEISAGHLVIAIRAKKFDRELGVQAVSQVEKVTDELQAITVDLAMVEYIDSLGVDALLRAWRLSMSFQVRFSVVGAHDTVLDVLKACHLDELLHLE